SNFATLSVAVAPVATVAVTLVPASVVVGQTSQATALLKDAGGNALTGRSVVWSSSNPRVAVVHAAGVVTAVAAGSSDITAASEGKSGVATITVTAAPVATVAVSLASTTVTTGQTVQATAVLKDAANNTLVGRIVVWTSSNTAVATVNSSTGLVTASSTGSTNIVATSEGKSNFATLSVTIVPVATVVVTLTPGTIDAVSTSQASAVVKDAAGNVLTGRAVFWSSSNNAVATVNSSTGLITAVAAGTATITAASETKSASKDLSVTPAPVATVAVTLNPPGTTPSQTSQATALLKDANGNTLTGRGISWLSSNTNVATVNSSTGLITAVAVGATDISATSETKTGTATFTVAAAPVATVTVTLTPSTITTAQTSQGTAELKDAAGNTLVGRVVSWGTTNTGVATINSVTGLITPVAPGTTTISAISEGRSDSRVLTVTAPPPAPVASVAVTLAPTSVPVGQTSQGTAVLKDASNNTLTGRQIAWSSANTSVATVDAVTGVVTAIAVGSANIIATSEMRSNFATLTVTAPPPAPVNTVIVTLTPSTITTAQTSQATAVTKDAAGNTLTGRSISWGTSTPSVATVNAVTGLVTPVAPGTSTIIGSSEGKSDVKVITVTAPPPAPVASVTVSVAPNSIPAGQTAQASAVLKDADGNTLTGRVITWTSSNTSIATVSSTG
ncbi:MAG: Ig-like domain-containing protein, partial [Gemmatimonadota bacterium]|nr:Ig-like domain-containing protein [Gemmatimonadota bacterium]